MIDKIGAVNQPIDIEKIKPTNNQIEQHQQEVELKELTKEETKTLKDVVSILNSLPGNELEFGFNDEMQMATISVYERDKHRLIREFPSKEFFSRLSYFKENILPGLLMDTKA